MRQTDPLLAEIAALLEGAEGRDDPSRLERTLTDGYARALMLEAERLRLERQIGELAVAADQGDDGRRRELASLARMLKLRQGDIGALRAQLGRLHRRHSVAVRARA